MTSTTKHRKLRTGTSVWMRQSLPRLPVSPLKSGRRVDVVVIGAGVTGAMVAEELSEAGFSIAILDRRGAALGSTAVSTALVQYEIDQPLILLHEKIGVEKADLTWRRSRLAVESLACKIRERDISCQAHRRDSLYLSGNILTASDLRDEQEARARIGIRSRYLKRQELMEIYGIDHPAALLSYDNLSVHPRKLAAGLLQAALERDVTLHAPVEVETVLPHKEGVEVLTSDGKVVHARQVVFACGYEVPKPIRSRKYKVVSTWAIATKRQKRRLWKDEAFVWEAANPYMYVRTTADGRVICGGEDEEFSDEVTRDALLPEKTKTLERKLGEMFPDIDANAEFSWTGCFGTTATGLPSIGQIPGLKNVYAVLAFGGNGMTFSRIGAEILRAELTGKADRDAELFAFRE